MYMQPSACIGCLHVYLPHAHCNVKVILCVTRMECGQTVITLVGLCFIVGHASVGLVRAHLKYILFTNKHLEVALD